MYLLRWYGFGGVWCSWIQHCISSVWLSILVNGSPKGFFSSSRGLRQRDPLSSLLFVFVMEALSRMISMAVHVGLLEGFTVGNTIVSHLLFASGTRIFCHSMLAQLCYLRSLFLLLEAASGFEG